MLSPQPLKGNAVDLRFLEQIMLNDKIFHLALWNPTPDPSPKGEWSDKARIIRYLATIECRLYGYPPL